MRVSGISIEDVVRTGDTFVCRARRKGNKLFTWLTILSERSREVHAGVFVWKGLTLCVAEMRISGFHIEPLDLRIDELNGKYLSTHVYRPDYCNENYSNIVRSELNSMKGLRYGWLKSISIFFDWHLNSPRVVCSTVCERVYAACGNEIKEDWSPCDVVENGIGLGQITSINEHFRVQ